MFAIQIRGEWRAVFWGKLNPFLKSFMQIIMLQWKTESECVDWNVLFLCSKKFFSDFDKLFWKNTIKKIKFLCRDVTINRQIDV